MWGPSVLDEDDLFVYRLVDPFVEGQKLFLFFEEAFERDFSYEEYQWFKFGHPYSRNRVYVAQEKRTGRFASAICMLPFRYRLGPEIAPVSLCTGVVTHPDFRRKGLFVRINGLLRDCERSLGSNFGVGFPNSQALPGHLEAGWHVACHLTFLENREFEAQTSTAQSVNRFDAHYDSFLVESTARFDFCHVKDHRILNWRYRDRPGSSYHCFSVGNSDPQGIIVLKRFETVHEKKTHIVEFLSSTDDAAIELIRAAKTYAAGTDLINLWMPSGCPYEEMFRGHGFKPSRETAPLIFRPHDDFAVPESRSPWIVFGDSDVY